MTIQIVCMIGICLFTLAGGKVEVTCQEKIDRKLTINGRVLNQQSSFEESSDTIQLSIGENKAVLPNSPQ
ncbi:hypothetical protein ACFL57_04580 [Candidatus Margulisiibacteriota bacterium]